MRWKPLPVVGGSYADDAKPWSSQDTVNWLPVMAEKQGTRSASMLRGVPGLSLFADTGDVSGIRGMHDVEGRLFSVIGSTLYEFSTSTGAYSAMGSIPGVSRVSMAHNQVAGGNQLAIANGQSGYVFDTRYGTLEQITDDGFIGAKSFDFVDQYIVGIDPTGRRAFTSDLADATSYSTLDQYEAESAPDKIIGQIVTHREWWLMGSRTIEPFVDTGAGTGTFQRQSGVVIERGLAATHAVALLDNSVFWLGDDGIVYRANGYTPVRVSTHAIEQELSAHDFSKAFAFSWEDWGHKVFYITIQGGKTWGYDVASGEWHRRKSYGLDRWRINDLVKCNGAWYAGDYASGKIYKLDWNVQEENGYQLERIRSIGVIHDSENRLIINGLKLVIDSGGEDASSYIPSNSFVLSGDLTDTFVGEIVSYSYSESGSRFPLTYSIASGSLPDGLSMSSSGEVSGTASLAGSFSWVVSAIDEYGNSATLADDCVVYDQGIACGAATSYSGGVDFPNQVLVTLGSGTGDVTLTYATGENPDKLEVWVGGVKVIDTGYHGSPDEVNTVTGNTFQVDLSAYLAANSLPDEVISQIPGPASASADTQWDSVTNRETATFTKTTTDTTAIVKVYSPLAGTLWHFSLSCPGA